MTLKVAFDIGGVLSKYPHIFKPLISKLTDWGAGQGPAWEVHIISDMHPKEKIVEVLRLNGVNGWQVQNVHSADYATHGEACKAVLLEELGIDLFFDDFIGYVGIPGNTVRCLLMPNAELPYYHETWRSPDGEPDFGRRVSRRNIKGSDR